MDHASLTLLVTISFAIFTHGMKRFGRFEGTVNFNGLSLDEGDVSKERCAIRCFVSTCRGIYFDGGDCKNLFEPNDVPESDRNQYNSMSLSSSAENLLINVRHKCSSQNPCPYGGVCEAVLWIYQCNCGGTDHYGPRCETAGNPWTAPVGWDTLHPQLNLNLDHQTSYALHNGANHVSTENGYGFKTNGGFQFVDLGDWSNETCFVDIEQYEQGFTLLSYVNIVSANSGTFLGYISSTKAIGNAKSGAAIVGYLNDILFEFFLNGVRYFVQGPAAQYPTGWIRIMAVYRRDVGAELYIDNVLKATDYVGANHAVITEISGHIVLGRINAEGAGGLPGQLTVDWLAIWDRPLTEEERDLVHQS